MMYDDMELYSSGYIKGESIIVEGNFSKYDELWVEVYNDEGECYPQFQFSVNQVKNLMSHLQRALDEYGDRNNA